MSTISSWAPETTLLIPAGSTVRIRKQGKVQAHKIKLDLTLSVGDHYRGSSSAQGVRAYYFERDGFELKIRAGQIVEQRDQSEAIWTMAPYAPDLTIGSKSSAYLWCLENLELPRALHLVLGIRPWGDQYLTRDVDDPRTYKTSSERCDCAASTACAHMDLASNYRALERSIAHLHCLRWTLPEISELYNKGGAALVCYQAKSTRYAPDGLYYCAP